MKRGRFESSLGSVDDWGFFFMGFPCVRSASSPYLITFKALNIVVGPLFRVSLDLRVSSGATPSLLLPGGSGSLDIGVNGDAGNVSVTYLGSTYSKEFVTPIGSVKVPVFDVALGSLYVNVTGRVQTTPTVKGAADISPTSYSWVSAGPQSISITHRLSVYSLFVPDVITVEVPLVYVLTVAVGVEALGITVLGSSVNVGSLEGSPTITQDISTFPVGSFIVLVAAVVVAVRYWRIRRKGQRLRQRCRENQWILSNSNRRIQRV
jgi:hypothetical protein